MQTGDNPRNLNEKILAGRLLSLGAGRASAALDQFSSWLLSGFGAAFALLLANVDPVSRHLAVASLRRALLLFLVVLVLGVCSRLLAAIVGAAARAVTDADEIGAHADIEDFKVVFREIEAATFWPMRFAVASSLRKVEQGDLAAGGRLHAKLAQLQGAMVVLEVVLAAIVLWRLACGLTI